MEYTPVIFSYTIGLITSVIAPILRNCLFTNPKIKKEFIKELEYNLGGLKEFNKQVYNGIDIPDNADFVSSPSSWPVFYISTNFFDEHKKEIYKLIEIEDITVVGILYEQLHLLKILFTKSVKESKDDSFTIEGTAELIKLELEDNDTHAQTAIESLLQKYKEQKTTSMLVLWKLYTRKFKNIIISKYYARKEKR